jgi:hypothetical protein
LQLRELIIYIIKFDFFFVTYAENVTGPLGFSAEIAITE